MNLIEQPSTITVDGTEYPVSGFSDTVKRLVSIHTEWRNDLNADRIKVAKTEAALRNLDLELSQTVQSELKAAAEAKPEASNDETPVVKPAKKVAAKKVTKKA